jgi:hypothetical protein
MLGHNMHMTPLSTPLEGVCCTNRWFFCMMQKGASSITVMQKGASGITVTQKGASSITVIYRVIRSLQKGWLQQMIARQQQQQQQHDLHCYTGILKSGTFIISVTSG